MMQTRVIITTSAAFTIIAMAGSLTNPRIVGKVGSAGAAISNEPLSQIILTGIVRDFREYTETGGHPDFEQQPEHGFGRYSGNVATQLGDDGKPVWTGGGAKVTKQWRDAANRQICHALYDASRDDVQGSWGIASSGGVTSAASFDQWFRDVPGINVSAPLALTLVRQSDGSYVFDDKTDPLYASKGGFFPIDDQLFGNSPGTPKHNYHFTFELNTEFTYDAAGNQVFKFIGDDDVYVFINGRLVIDLGGVHAAHDQFVDLNRLGLEDGTSYTLSFFFAERHRTQSNFRIQTNLLLSSPVLPTITSSFD